MGKKIIIKTKEQIANIKQSGKHLSELLAIVKSKAKEGVMLIELEDIASNYLKQHNLKGAFKGYMGYPANLCLSVNDCVVHGIPDEYILKKGDLLKIDLGVDYKGGISDAAVSVVIGGEQTNPRAAQLTLATKQGLDLAIKEIGPGSPIYYFSKKIYDHLQIKGFSIIKNLTGHGVGNAVHEGPYIYNRPAEESKYTFFKPNMVVAVEPITAEISVSAIEKSKNSWNLFTAQGDLGGQREYTIVITNNGYEILAGIE